MQNKKATTGFSNYLGKLVMAPMIVGAMGMAAVNAAEPSTTTNAVPSNTLSTSATNVASTGSHYLDLSSTNLVLYRMVASKNITTLDASSTKKAGTNTTYTFVPVGPLEKEFRVGGPVDRTPVVSSNPNQPVGGSYTNLPPRLSAAVKTGIRVDFPSNVEESDNRECDVNFGTEFKSVPAYISGYLGEGQAGYKVTELETTEAIEIATPGNRLPFSLFVMPKTIGNAVTWSISIAAEANFTSSTTRGSLPTQMDRQLATASMTAK